MKERINNAFCTDVISANRGMKIVKILSSSKIYEQDVVESSFKMKEQIS